MEYTVRSRRGSRGRDSTLLAAYLRRAWRLCFPLGQPVASSRCGGALRRANRRGIIEFSAADPAGPVVGRVGDVVLASGSERGQVRNW